MKNNDLKYSTSVGSDSNSNLLFYVNMTPYLIPIFAAPTAWPKKAREKTGCSFEITEKLYIFAEPTGQTKGHRAVLSPLQSVGTTYLREALASLFVTFQWAVSEPQVVGRTSIVQTLTLFLFTKKIYVL